MLTNLQVKTLHLQIKEIIRTANNQATAILAIDKLFHDLPDTPGVRPTKDPETTFADEEL